MRIERPSPEKRQRSTGEIFIGEVDSQPVVGEEARDLRLNEITFRNGARNRLHTHTTDQVLVVTAGEGIIATEHEEHAIRTGDIAYIPAGERHWHGAKPGKSMTHWSILGPANTRIVD